MTEMLYLSPLPEDSPLVADPTVDFTSAKLNEDGTHVAVGDHPPRNVHPYPCKNIMNVSKGAYETIVIMCADDNGLAEKLAAEIKDRPVLAYYRYAFHLSQMLRLPNYPGTNWQIVLSQPSQARPKVRYDTPYNPD